jgi:hypothetical protein
MRKEEKTEIMEDLKEGLYRVSHNTFPMHTSFRKVRIVLLIPDLYSLVFTKFEEVLQIRYQWDKLLLFLNSYHIM